jgi:hypothetical protein
MQLDTTRGVGKQEGSSVHETAERNSRLRRNTFDITGSMFVLHLRVPGK